MRLGPFALLLPALAVGQTNLNFQNGRAGELPPGWFVLDAAKGPGFSASWQHDGCRAAAPCAVLSAPAAATAGISGTLMESFAALPFRGQQVRLRAWIRLEKKSPSDRAQMLLHVGRPGLQEGFTDNMADRPVVTEEWGQYEIRGEVVSDAETIQIGLTLHGAGRVWMSEVEFSTVTSETAGPQLNAACDAIQRQYQRMDAAFMRGDANEIAAVLMPGAQMGVGTVREPLLPAIRAEIGKGSMLTAKTEVASVRLDGDEAIAMVRREAHDQGNSSRSVVTSHRDTWIQTSNGWRWRESIEVSYHWVLPATSADAAGPVVADLKTRAVPLAASDDLAAFGAAVSDARIVALGEGARGTREFSQWKQRLVEYLVAQKGFKVLAGVKDAELQALADRLHVEFVPLDDVTADSVAHSAKLADAKVVLWTDNSHARDAHLRDKFGRKLYVVGFGFDRGQVRAVGVEKGESRGLGVYAAPPSPVGSGDAVLSAAGIPQFFLNLAKLPAGSPLARWLAEMHLFHDMGGFWVLDDPDASLQPEELGLSYDGLFFVEEVHAGA